MERKIMPKSVPLEVVLNDYLKTPERAMSYLKSAFEENDPELFQAALEDVISVQEKALISLPTLPKLVESLQRHGVE
jgi:DNA-binding phage protein